LKKIPIVGNAAFRAINLLLGFNLLVPILVNDVFIEMCIWLAIKPFGYRGDFGKLEPDIKPQFDTDTAVVDDRGITKDIGIQDTPGGWMPYDCFMSAQTVVNTVNNEAAS